MSRGRRDNGILVETIAMFAEMPLWMAPIGAIILYVAFAYVPEWVGPHKTPPDPIFVWISTMCKVLAPYVAGAVLLSGLFGAAKLATTRVAASTSTAASTTLQQIKSQGPGDFEKMCAEILRAQGWQVDVAPPGADGGIDLRMRNADEQAYGQCKNWNTWKVPVTSIREFYGVMCRDGVKRGYFITSGKFTAEARREARGMGIELFDGAALQKHLNR